MTLPNNEDAFLSQVKDQLNRGSDTLDKEVVARLRRARYEALHSKPKHIPGLWPISGLATACTALLVVAIWWERPVEPVPNGTAQIVEDVEVLTATDQLDFYEDLEFYGWLAETERAS